MPKDVNAYLTAQQAKLSPDKAEEWAEFQKLYNKKLWHQLTLKLLVLVKVDYLQEGTALLELYENFIADFENKINPLKLVEILVFVVKKISDYDQCIEFVSKTKEKLQKWKVHSEYQNAIQCNSPVTPQVKGDVEAVALCNIISGRLKLDHGDIDGVKKILEETEEIIESMDGVSSVHGRYYQLSSDYYQIIGQHAQYYRDALRFLGCTDIKEISLDDQKSRAFTLALAALLGDGVYNFGELLAHPILDSLKGTGKQWVVDLLYAFNSGNLAKYEEFRTFWKEQPDLASQELALRQKISLLCLMEMTFNRPGNHRTLTFAEIAKEARLPEHEVELLVMKALSLELVRGSIDQVDKTVNMFWVQPRVLAKDQIGNMKQRLEQWCKDVQSMEILLETKAHDILT